MQKISRHALTLILLGSLLVPVAALAQSFPSDAASVTSSAGVSNTGGTQAVFTPMTNVKGTPFASIFSNTNGNLQEFFQSLFKTAITIGALLAVLEIAYGGWLFMTTDIVDKRGEAKKRIQNALLGLLMLLATVLILNQINPNITSLSLLTGSGQGAVNTGGTNPTGTVADQGVATDDPSGQYCINGGVSGNTPTSYTCYSSESACQQVNGAEGACTAYSSTYSQRPDHSQQLPAGVTQAYGDVKYNAAMGQNADGSQRSCSEVYSAGWEEIPASSCGASEDVPGASCCALPNIIPYQDESTIPANDYCFVSSSASASKQYFCATDRETCASQQVSASTAGTSVGQSCAQFHVSYPASDASMMPAGQWCYMTDPSASGKASADSTFECWTDKSSCLSAQPSDGSIASTCIQTTDTPSQPVTKTSTAASYQHFSALDASDKGTSQSDPLACSVLTGKKGASGVTLDQCTGNPVSPDGTYADGICCSIPATN